MDGFWNAISASLVLLLLMAVGYGMGQLGWMHQEEKRFLNRYMVNIAVPCTCISGLLNNLDRDQLLQAGGMVLAAMCGIVVTLAVSVILARLLRIPRPRWGVFVAMTGLSNVLFIGLPVCTQLFGEVCIPYVMLYYLVNTTFVQSVGLMLIQYSGQREGAHTRIPEFLKSLLLKPPVLGVLAAILLLYLGLRPPEVVMKFAGYIGNTVSPLALIYSGYILFEVGLKNLRLMKGLPTMLVVRLAISPVISMGIFPLFGMDGLPLQVFVVESSLPVVSQVPVLAGAYGADEQYAATGACFSTLCSVVTIPILMLLI